MKEAQLFTDGASRGNPGPAGAGYVLADPHGGIIVQRGIPLGVATNNVAEYRALIEGLTEAHRQGITHLQVFTDSELMVRQMIGVYKCRNPGLRPLLVAAAKLRARFEAFRISHVPREMNNLADGLAGEAAKRSARGQAE